LARKHGHRTILAVPLLRERRALGTILLRRPDVRPFDDKHIALLKTFADQAAIAIENVRLFNETKEALDQQTATAEVLKTISRSTFDLDSVLRTLMVNATRMCNAVKGVMFLPDAEGRFVPAVVHGYEPESPMLAELRARPIRPGRGSGSGRALLERRVIHIPDVLADPLYDRRELAQLGRMRTLLSVPMLLRGEPIGVISMSRGTEVEPFNDKQLELVTTFADQAVIAIENVRLFKEIEDKSRQLEIANKHKSEFLANMSHELRTPLNAIIGFSEVLIERMFGEVNEKQADYLKDIHESGRHLLSLINDILDLSKIEAGRMELELSSFHLPTALSNAMTLVRERAQRHGIALGLEVDPRLGELQADERKFKQIVLNLLSNAVKFTPDGGRVEVTARPVESKIEIAVRDTGVGIAPGDHAAVFEEFKQVGRDYTRKAEGTGLGLALTRRFVELHGGEIRLESAPGKGSTFTVTFPWGTS
ncbi:MAG TPA: ATP-binding protein, partial [Burkholderiales bacterium]|nr:ATP-binding protein [Burkholderiales bacterium]